MARPLLFLVVLLVALAGCGDQLAARGDIGSRPVQVTATTNFIADTVRAVGGDRVEVTGLMGPGVDPHLYKASAADVRALRDADVIVYGGLQLEGKMADLLDALARTQTTRAISEAIPRDRLLAPQAGAPANEEFDPHVWFDVALWREAVGAVRDTLVAADPAHRDEYERNTTAYLAELDALDRYARERLGSIPRERRVLVTSHDAFAYLGRAYDLDVEAIQGISTAAEATTDDIRRVADVIAERDVRAVFVESSVPPQTIEAVVAAARARGARVAIGEELFSDAAGDAGTPAGTYVGMVRANVDRIVAGLR